jgi:hypothetical protein
LTRSTHKSKAKFGAALVVARYRDIASIHDSGRCRNVAEDISTAPRPT